MNVYGGEKKCGQAGGSLVSLSPASLEANATMAGGKRMRKVSGKARRSRRRSSSAGGSRKRKSKKSKKNKKSKKSRKH